MEKVDTIGLKNIKFLNIKKMFSLERYERGYACYKNDSVSDLSYDINNDVWTATVYDTENYFAEIDLKNAQKGTIAAYCDCPAFSAYGSCEHNVAVLLAIDEKQKQSNYERSYTSMDRFIEAVSQTKKSDIDVLPQQVPMHVEYICKWTFENNLYLEIKTGEQRRYVVRNLRELIETVMAGEPYTFTKNFTYDPDIHYFLARDLNIFEHILAIYRNEDIYEQQSPYAYDYQATQTKRSLIIPPLFAEQLLTQLVARDFTLEKDNDVYKHLTIEKDTLPIQFSLKEDGQTLMLALQEETIGTYLETYQIYFADGTFYFPKKEQQAIIEQMYEYGLNNHEQFPIDEKNSDAFLSDVLPLLQQVGDVSIDETVAQKIVRHPLKASLYLELKDFAYIVGRLVYSYGSHEIDPFNEEKPLDKYMIRDSAKEEKVMRMIEHANFKYNGKELFIASDEEEMYDFLYSMVPYMENYVDIYLTNDIRQYVMDVDPMPQTNIAYNESSNLLEVGFQLEGVADEEIDAVLQAIIEKKKYYRLQSGKFLSLENESFNQVEQFISSFHSLDKDAFQEGAWHVPVHQMGAIDGLETVEKNYAPSFAKLLDRVKHPENIDLSVPETLQASLRNYQETGFKWFKTLSEYGLGGILADDMGLGKTVQTITYLLSEPSDLPHLIVVPSSVVYNWKNECKRFAPSLTVEVLTGPVEQRREKIAEAGGSDVWITSYHTLRQDFSLYESLNFKTLILDEAQFVKNYRTKTSQAVRGIQANRTFALSGTPIENSMDELWSIFQVVLPGFMPPMSTFRQMSSEQVAKLARPFILRRLKEDVLTELPEKIESVHVSELTDEQKRLYVGYLRQLQTDVNASIKASGFQQSRMKILAGLTRLRQICCHPSLFAENYTGESGKLEQLMEIVMQSLENNKRMLIFSQFTSMHEIIKERLDDENIEYFYLDGQTPSEDRVKMADAFNAGKHSVFLISLRAGGTGLNLTGADTVVLYDLWWNPAVEDQATGRAHRFGQKNVVQVFRLITEGTIEEKIYELQQKKRQLMEQIIHPGETLLTGLTEEEIKDLLGVSPS